MKLYEIIVLSTGESRYIETDRPSSVIDELMVHNNLTQETATHIMTGVALHANPTWRQGIYVRELPPLNP